jgi:hypothetical protein
VIAHWTWRIRQGVSGIAAIDGGIVILMRMTVEAIVGRWRITGMLEAKCEALERF